MEASLFLEVAVFSWNCFIGGSVFTKRQEALSVRLDKGLWLAIIEVASERYYNNMIKTDTIQRGTLNQKEKVLFSFDKSLKEQVRVSETIYLDKPYIDFRIFARKADGEYIPTKKGITISKDLAKFLKQAFNKIN